MQQHEFSAKASAVATIARNKREVMVGMLETLVGLAMKKTVMEKMQRGMDDFPANRTIRQDEVQTIERTFSTIRRGFGSCSCSMCGE
jgi:hypothetical protein